MDLFTSIAIGERFLAGCPVGMKEVHIFDWQSGMRSRVVHDDSGSDDDDDVFDSEEEDAEFIYPLQMHIVGDLLISTSRLGNALCIWQMRTGSLLHRYEDAFTYRRSYQLPDGVDATSMIHLREEGYTAFVTTSYNETVWAFPETDDGLMRFQGMARQHGSFGNQGVLDDVWDSESSDDDGDY
jgi:hypothetical protein